MPHGRLTLHLPLVVCDGLSSPQGIFLRKYIDSGIASE